MREARRAGLPADDVTPLGSLRRWAPDIGDVSLLAVAEPAAHDEVLDGFLQLPIVTAVLADCRRASKRRPNAAASALHVTAAEDAGAALVWHTGARRHTEQLQARATRLGLVLARRSPQSAEWRARVHARRGRRVSAAEPAVHFAGAARRASTKSTQPSAASCPMLVSPIRHPRRPAHAQHLERRPRQHCSTWSSPPNSSATSTSRSPITPSGRSRRASCSRCEIPIQRDEIDMLRSRIQRHRDPARRRSRHHARRLARLRRHPARAASTSSSPRCTMTGGDDGARLTERYLQAMRHPLVNIITHPANRSPALSPGYDLDYDRLFEAAVADRHGAWKSTAHRATSTWTASIARRAVDAGVTLDDRQRLPSRRGARAADAIRGRHRPARLDRSPLTC